MKNLPFVIRNDTIVKQLKKMMMPFQAIRHRTYENDAETTLVVFFDDDIFVMALDDDEQTVCDDEHTPDDNAAPAAKDEAQTTTLETPPLSDEDSSSISRQALGHTISRFNDAELRNIQGSKKILNFEPIKTKGDRLYKDSIIII
uniref:Uncharacterized protein n=1 Tax=Romanomermis culicivorax TaxID=13658 RepID=A0A915J875_ROMCU